MDVQSVYQRAIVFATRKHVEKNQTVPGTHLPYVVHLSNVAMEILVAAPHSPELKVEVAVQIALLHDTLEDTDTTLEELTQLFGTEIAEGVAALTKNEAVPKIDRMKDSLHRIKQQPKEVWAVKLADRITNLQKPPAYWESDKRKEYQKEAQIILEELKGGNAYLEHRLKEKIVGYGNFIVG